MELAFQYIIAGVMNKLNKWIFASRLFFLLCFPMTNSKVTDNQIQRQTKIFFLNLKKKKFMNITYLVAPNYCAKLGQCILAYLQISKSINFIILKTLTFQFYCLDKHK